MRPIVKTLGSTAVATASIAALQTTAGAGYLTLTASPVTFTYAQQVSLTSAADVHTINFTITGTDSDGHVISEVMAGPASNTVLSTNFWLTITSIYVSAAVGSNTSAGNTALSVTQSLILDYINPVSSWTISATTSGSGATYKLQYTFDDPFALVTQDVWYDDATMTAKTGNFYLASTLNARAVRLAITAWTSGTVTATVIQGLQA